ncbi:nickel ABC transporter, nickel/metallophore periplasmic binding protein [Jannaschia seosinensis]|uniref:Nickel ABC transporter, nickel/metallophore periplasmic binding protein n=1 Tax=Jannaschia seosinensis TaxID=313367 RepID=A0A0M7BA26_9RHOB|nr:extracellular solute-binding protein [Jannaschia seosinensis]CUH38230.1 nickel ABC transporter, nickel/metallophore periplasmic binding protein [Jannaschia seosinensis]
MLRRIAAATLAATLALPAFAQEAGDDAIVVSHGYSYFGELKYGPDEPFSYVNVDAPKGGEISLSALGTFDSFNMSTRKGNPEPTASDVFYDTMMIAAADDPYAIYCLLCTTVEYPESLDWVVVNLRDDVRFTDGTPMTAEDMKFTIDLYLTQGIAEFRNVFTRYYDSVEVTAPHQLRFEFSNETPVRDRMGLIALWRPFSKSWFEETDARLDESTLEPFLGTGPYKLGDLDVGRSVVYEKKDDWWGADLPINQGRYNFDSIRIEYFADSAAAFEGFKAGEYTFRIENSSKEWATSYDFPAVKRGDVVVETLPDGNITTAQGFIFNLKRDKWQDPRVRDAIRAMFNFEWSNETLFYGLYERPESFWGGSELAAEGAPGDEEITLLEPLVEEGLLDPSVLSEEAATPPVNDPASNRPDRRTRRAAQQLLNEAGWEAGPGGMLRNEAGERLELVILQFSPTFDRVINPYIENLRDLGIDARLERVDRAQYIERRRAGDWDLTNHSPGQDFEPSLGLKQWFHSETAEDSSRNLMALADLAVDRLIDAVIEAETLEELRPRVRALDRVLRAQGFWIPQWTNSEHWVAYWDMYDHPEAIPPLDLGVLDFWWFDAEGYAELRASGAL